MSLTHLYPLPKLFMQLLHHRGVHIDQSVNLRDVRLQEVGVWQWV